MKVAMKKITLLIINTTTVLLFAILILGLVFSFSVTKADPIAPVEELVEAPTENVLSPEQEVISDENNDTETSPTSEVVGAPTESVGTEEIDPTEDPPEILETPLDTLPEILPEEIVPPETPPEAPPETLETLLDTLPEILPEEIVSPETPPEPIILPDTEISIQNTLLTLPGNLSEPLTISSKNRISEIPLEMTVENGNIESALTEEDSSYFYRDVFINTDLKYEITENGIKEFIILKDKVHPALFQYQLNLDQFDPVQTSPSTVVLYKKGESGNNLFKLYTLSAPLMSDNEGRESAELVFTIKDNILTLTPDTMWLAQATYPVTIDPTIEVTVLNIHSHPVAGENWKVDFITVGVADLYISPADQATIDEDEFTTLTCGSEDRTLNAQILAGDVIFYPAWQCDGVATLSHLTLVTGNHHLLFEFAGAEEMATAEAFNAVINLSGTTNAADSLTVRVAVNGSLAAETGTTATSAWSISNVTVNSGEVVVVWLDGVADSAESTAVAKYDGTGDMTGIVLNTNVLSIGSVDDQSLTVADLDPSGTGYECTDDEDVMYDATTTALNVHGSCSTYTDETIQIESGDTLTVDSDETLTTDNLTITGTLTQTTTGVITATGNIASSGTFNGGSGAISTVDLTISGGTFNSTSGTMTLTRDWTHTAGGTFNHNTGTVKFALDNYTSGTFNVSTNETFNNLKVEGGPQSYTLTITSGDTLIALGTFTHATSAIDTGTIEARGNVVVGAAAAGGSAKLNFTGSNAQTYTDNGCAEPTGDIVINKTNQTDTVTLATAADWNNGSQDVTVTQGTLRTGGFN